MSGLFLIRELSETSRRVIIRRVVQGSPAEEGDIREGDELIGIDGQLASQVSLTQLRETLRVGAGRMVDLIVLRDGVRLNREIRLRPLV